MTERRASDAGSTKNGKLNIEAADAQAFSGSVLEAFQTELLRQVSRAVYLPEWKTDEQKRESVIAAVDAIKNIAPRNELEGMLASQMVSAHNAALECLRRAMHPNQNDEGMDLNLKHAAKLMALYERQLAALDKHRGKGRQTDRGARQSRVFCRRLSLLFRIRSSERRERFGLSADRLAIYREPGPASALPDGMVH